MTDLETDGVPAMGTGEEDGGYSFLDAEPEPCNNFRLDTSRSFGMCKCGHPKSAHNSKGENKAAQMLSRLKHENEKRSVGSVDGIIEPGDRPCNKFRLDTTASEFGMCKCGFRRADHVGHEDNKAKLALENLKNKNQEKYSSDRGSSGGGACDNYRVDTTANAFGVCVCGYKKDDHVAKDENVAARMLKNLKEKNAEKHAKEDLQAMGLGDDDVAAEQRRVDELTKQEQMAAQRGGKEGADKKKKKKKGKFCVIS